MLILCTLKWSSLKYVKSRYYISTKTRTLEMLPGVTFKRLEVLNFALSDRHPMWLLFGRILKNNWFVLQNLRIKWAFLGKPGLTFGKSRFKICVYEILRWILCLRTLTLCYTVLNLVLVKFVSAMFSFFLDWDIELRWNNLKANISCKIFARPSFCQQKKCSLNQLILNLIAEIELGYKKCIHKWSLKSILRVLSE